MGNAASRIESIADCLPEICTLDCGTIVLISRGNASSFNKRFNGDCLATWIRRSGRRGAV